MLVMDLGRSCSALSYATLALAELLMRQAMLEVDSLLSLCLLTGWMLQLPVAEASDPR
jgi:hypothetical protein